MAQTCRIHSIGRRIACAARPLCRGPLRTYRAAMPTIERPSPASRRRALTLAAALPLGGALLAACGQGATPETSAPAADAPPSRLIAGNGFAMGERLEWAQQATAEFSRLNGPKLTAEHNVISGD